MVQTQRMNSGSDATKANHTLKTQRNTAWLKRLRSGCFWPLGLASETGKPEDPAGVLVMQHKARFFPPIRFWPPAILMDSREKEQKGKPTGLNFPAWPGGHLKWETRGFKVGREAGQGAQPAPGNQTACASLFLPVLICPGNRTGWTGCNFLPVLVYVGNGMGCKR